MRKRQTDEEVFYTSLIRLIKGQLIEDPNFKQQGFKQSWYEQNNKLHYGLFKSKAEYILEEIEKMKHLILFDE